MASEAADDYNDDGEIDEEDFKLFVDRLFEGGPDGPGGPFPGDGPFVPAFEDWLASEAADDYNDDGEIDEEDFKLFVDRLFEGGPDGPFLFLATVLSFLILRIGWPAKQPMTITTTAR